MAVALIVLVVSLVVAQLLLLPLLLLLVVQVKFICNALQYKPQVGDGFEWNEKEGGMSRGQGVGMPHVACNFYK